jgi:hypothetical protein
MTTAILPDILLLRGRTQGDAFDPEGDTFRAQGDGWTAQGYALHAQGDTFRPQGDAVAHKATQFLPGLCNTRSMSPLKRPLTGPNHG